MEDVSLHKSVARVAGFWMARMSDKNIMVKRCYDKDFWQGFQGNDKMEKKEPKEHPDSEEG